MAEGSEEDRRSAFLRLLHGAGLSQLLDLADTFVKDESLEDTENLPEPDVIAREIADNLESALEQFREIAKDLE